MKYLAQPYDSPSPEDNAEGRTWEVVHRQAWDNGRWLPPLCQRATKDDAERIAVALSRLPEAERLLAEACRVMNDRGRLDPGGCDLNTEDGFLHREIREFLDLPQNGS